MKNIVYIPLDERPCNSNFVQMLSKDTDYNILVPPVELLNRKKETANVDVLWEWVFKNTEMADGAILSLDMLIYGGLLPSRLHNLSIDNLKSRVQNIRKLKEINPKIKIFAFNLIMRCPSYSSSDEEPDYYETWGHEIFRFGWLQHRVDLKLADNAEAAEYETLKNKIPTDIIDDYTHRRHLNHCINKMITDLVQDNAVDFLVIPQDDSAPYGYTAIDQQSLRNYVLGKGLNFKIYTYPGADEVGMTLLSRMINEDKHSKPCVYVRYSSTYGPFTVPLYEDRMLNETVKYHILCAGGIICDSLSDADCVLMVNSPGKIMLEAWEQKNKNTDYNVNRNLVEFVEYIDYIINTKNLPCAVADSAFSNGGDLELIKNLSNKNLLFKVSSYAGWNTNSNTLGTSIAQMFIYKIYGKTPGHLDFLGLRYAEDAAYCSHVRKHVTDEHLENTDYNYFHIDGQRGCVSKIVESEIKEFISSNLHDDKYEIVIQDLYMPWSRMFEVGLSVKVTQKTPGYNYER